MRRNNVATDKTAGNTAIEKEKSKFDLVGFFKDSKAELAKVIWPNRQQLISESLAVVLMVSLSAAVIFGVNGLFVEAAKIIFKTPG
jgi:preprotein translocase subunit SecE